MGTLCSPLRNWLCLLLALGWMLGWAGCTSHPLGLSDQAWQALPAEKKAELTARQVELDQQRTAEHARRQEAERAAREEAAQKARAERAALYQNARYGDIVTITLEGGGAKLGGKLCRFEPVSIDLIRGERAVLTLRRHDKIWVTTEVEIELSEDANTVILAPEERHRFVAVNRGWERLQTYPITFVGRNEQDPELKDCRLTVRYRRLY